MIRIKRVIRRAVAVADIVSAARQRSIAGILIGLGDLRQ